MSGQTNPVETEADKKKKNGFVEGLLDFFNPFSGGGGLGGIFQFLIVAVVGYFAARSEWLQGLLNKMSDGLGDKVHGFIEKAELWVKSKLSGEKEMSDETKGEMFNVASYEDAKEHGGDQLPKAIIKDAQTYDSFKATVMEANGGKVSSINDLMNAKSIFALATKQPEMLKALLKEYSNNGAPMTADTKAKMVVVMQSLKEIVSDGRVDVLLNNAHRKNTLSMLATLDPTMNVSMLETMLASQMKNGKLSPEARNMLSAAIDGKMAALSEGTAEAGKAAATSPAAAGDMVQAQLGALLGGDKFNMAALKRLKTDLGEKRWAEFSGVLMAQDETKINLFCTKSQNIGIISDFARAVKLEPIATPEFKEVILGMKDIANNAQLRKGVSAVADKGIDPMLLAQKLGSDVNGNTLVNEKGEKATITAEIFMTQMWRKDIQDYIGKAGVGNAAQMLAGSSKDPAQKAMFTEENLGAILRCMKALSANPKNKPSSQLVFSTIMKLLVDKDQSALAQLDPAATATFFSDPINCAAVTGLVKSLRIGGAEGRMLQALRQHWGNKDDGIVEVLMDPAAIEKLPSLLTTKKDKLSLGFEMLFDDTKLGENAGHLSALAKAMDVQQGSSLTPGTGGKATAVPKQNIL